MGIDEPVKTVRHHAGKFGFIPVATRVQVEAHRPADARCAVLRIPDPIYQEVLPDLCPHGLREKFNQDDPLLAHLMQAIFLARDNRDDRMLVDHLTHTIVARTGRWFAGAPPPNDDRPLRDRIHRVIEYIEANIGEHLMIMELAGIANMSPYHFARSFKHLIGESPRRFILQRRVFRAQSLIRDGRIRSLTTIALAIGFASQSHMNEVFRKLVGCTPGEFRRQAT